MYYFYKKLSPRRGFTIIELLVVIAIIGILASVALGPFAKSQAVARDRARQSDLKSLSLSVTLYKEALDQYPDAAGAGCSGVADDNKWSGPNASTDTDFVKCDSNNGNDWIVDLVTKKLIGELPKDPRFEGESDKGYYYRTNATVSNPDPTEYKILLKNVAEEITVSPTGTDFSGYGDSCTPTATQLAQAANDYAVYYDNNPGDGTGAECW